MVLLSQELKVAMRALGFEPKKEEVRWALGLRAFGLLTATLTGSYRGLARAVPVPELPQRLIARGHTASIVRGPSVPTPGLPTSSVRTCVRTCTTLGSWKELQPQRCSQDRTLVGTVLLDGPVFAPSSDRLSPRTE